MIVNKLMEFVENTDLAIYQLEKTLNPIKFKEIQHIVLPIRHEIKLIKRQMKEKGNYCKMLYSSDIERLQNLGFTKAQICTILGVREAYFEEYLEKRSKKI